MKAKEALEAELSEEKAAQGRAEEEWQSKLKESEAKGQQVCSTDQLMCFIRVSYHLSSIHKQDE